MTKKESQTITWTKQQIGTALLHLLEQKELDDVTVKELCEKAGYTRATFYKYFSSPEQVLNYLSQWYYQRLDQIMSQDALPLQERIEEGLDFQLQNRFLVHVIRKSGANCFGLEWMDYFSWIDDESEKKSMAGFMKSGINEIIEIWLQDENRVPARQEAELICWLIEQFSEKALL